MSGRREELMARIREVGRAAVTKEEMLRLGFWPPEGQPATREAERQRALAELRTAEADLLAVRRELSRVEGQIAEAGDLEALIAQIRKRRIERVRTQREARRQEKTRQLEERRDADRQRRRERPPFLGHGVSAGLRYEGGDPARVAALGLPGLTTASEIAAAIGIDEGVLAWLTYHRGAATIDHYHRFTIPKRGGGERVISAPKSRLRVAQGWVLRAILARLEPHEAAMAFRPARNIAQNAAIHQGRAVVVRLDLRDFFPSITFRRVRGLFRHFGYNEGVATILALLTTEAPRLTLTLDGARRYVSVEERQLPQGACTSPAITNILCRGLDGRLSGLARRFGFTYTRYADDMIFSHAEREAPLGAFLTLARSVLASESFVINERKTRVMRPRHRQVVNGLVVNGAPAISRVDLRRFRAFLHHCERDGLEAVSTRLGRNARAYALGYLSFMHMVSPEKAAVLRAAHPWLQ